jgi:hypothetical protein
MDKRWRRLRACLQHHIKKFFQSNSEVLLPNSAGQRVKQRRITHRSQLPHISNALKLVRRSRSGHAGRQQKRQTVRKGSLVCGRTCPGQRARLRICGGFGKELHQRREGVLRCRTLTTSSKTTTSQTTGSKRNHIWFPKRPNSRHRTPAVVPQYGQKSKTQMRHPVTDNQFT